MVGGARRQKSMRDVTDVALGREVARRCGMALNRGRGAVQSQFSKGRALRSMRGAGPQRADCRAERCDTAVAAGAGVIYLARLCDRALSLSRL
jgi:hypothetical protein